MKQNFDSIDLAKFIGSILIFLMHLNIFREITWASYALQLITRWGVPFFFICSAYLLYKKVEKGHDAKAATLSYINRIMLLYMAWFIFNLPSIVNRYFSGANIYSIPAWASFFKKMLLSSTFTGSWYLASCIFSAAFIYISGKRFSSKNLILITLPIYICCALTSLYAGLLPSFISSVLGRFLFPLNIFNGLFYFALGKYVAENEDKLLARFPKAKCTITILVLYATYIAEFLAAKFTGIYGSTDVALTVAPIGMFILLRCLHSDATIPSHHILRKMSVIIYCCQGNILLIPGFAQFTIGMSRIASLVATVSVAFAISAIIIFIQAHAKWNWTKYLT